MARPSRRSLPPSLRHLLPALAWAALAPVAAALTGCRTTPRAGQAADTQATTTLLVENRAFLDVNVYVVRSGGQRIRLGTVTGNSTGRLRIPSDVVGGIGALRFIADPVGANRSPVSEEISVRAGDEVRMIIPPG
jgi:hypothetical protein